MADEGAAFSFELGDVAFVVAWDSFAGGAQAADDWDLPRKRPQSMGKFELAVAVFVVAVAEYSVSAQRLAFL